MQVEKSSHRRRFAGRLAVAAFAALFGAPSLAIAGKPPTAPPPPPPPPPGPAAPAAQPLNLDPNVHWFASWDQRTNPPVADFIVTPSSDDGIGFAQTQLNASAASAPARPLGLIAQSPLSSTNASVLFDAHYPQPAGAKAISYVFADFEGPSRLSETTTLVSQVRTSAWSRNAYVGNFDLTPIKGAGNEDGFDPTRRGPVAYSASAYASSGVNMANTALYPGATSFRNASTSDWDNANIRSGLFVGPITRFTVTQNVLDASYNGADTTGIALNKHKHIPWVARFNNWGNVSLDSDGNGDTGYHFVPGAPLPSAGLSGAQTADQMMGRGDFSAQVLHYRMRGAYSVNLLAVEGPNGGGAVGYNAAAAQDDVRDGWYGASEPAVAHADAIFAAPDNQRATMTHNPIVDATAGTGGKRAEQTGTMWSGVYSLSQKKLDILASNLDTMSHKIKFGTVDVYEVFLEKNGSGFTHSDGADALGLSRNALVAAGMHRLLQFDLVTTRVYKDATFSGKYSTKTVWLLNQDYVVFGNNNRNDVGVPEPTTFGLLATAAVAGLCRRHRRPRRSPQA